MDKVPFFSNMGLMGEKEKEECTMKKKLLAVLLCGDDGFSCCLRRLELE